jgi:hypothetical protein
MRPQPTLGRTVLYHYLDGGNGFSSPAIVTNGHGSGHADLCVFAIDKTFHVQNVKPSEDEGFGPYGSWSSLREHAREGLADLADVLVTETLTELQERAGFDAVLDGLDATLRAELRATLGARLLSVLRASRGGALAP